MLGPCLFQIQGSVIVGSVFQMVIGMTGAVGFLLRFIGPLTVTPIVTLIGLSLFDTIPGLAEHNWWIALGYSNIHDIVPRKHTELMQHIID